MLTILPVLLTISAHPLNKLDPIWIIICRYQVVPLPVMLRWDPVQPLMLILLQKIITLHLNLMLIMLYLQYPINSITICLNPAAHLPVMLRWDPVQALMLIRPQKMIMLLILLTLTVLLKIYRQMVCL